MRLVSKLARGSSRGHTSYACKEAGDGVACGLARCMRARAICADMGVLRAYFRWAMSLRLVKGVAVTRRMPVPPHLQGDRRAAA